MKIDKRKKYIITIDTEGQNKIYEIGIIVSDKKGNILLKRNYILNNNIDEVYNFKSDYIYKKLFQINENIKNKNAVVLYSDEDLKQRLLKIIQYFNINEIYCFNTLHDKKLLQSYINLKIQWFDIWSIACQVLGTQKLFKSQADKTAKGNYKTNVETFYKYITQKEYKQSHNALEDAKQELEILVRCFKSHIKIDKNINVNCWKKLNQINI